MTEPTVTQCDRDLAEALASCPYVPDIALAIARTRAEAEAAMLLAAAALTHKRCITDGHDDYAVHHALFSLEQGIQRLISSDAAAALARRDAETRLDEWRRVKGLGETDGVKSLEDWATDFIIWRDERIESLTRQLDEAKAPKEGR